MSKKEIIHGNLAETKGIVLEKKFSETGDEDRNYQMQGQPGEVLGVKGFNNFKKLV